MPTKPDTATQVIQVIVGLFNLITVIMAFIFMITHW